ncbi:MAG: aldo/keto reductase [Bowdeniella nasicola]|nr:aldo/keto reductase [Bowdeniella nasicola]
MEQRTLGQTGLRVSATALGTMTWGSDTDEHEAKDLLTEFLDAGGTLLDTAPGYGQGTAEEVVGSLMSGSVNRRDVVLMTKAGVTSGPDGSAQIETSRRTLLNSLDDSLARLGTDHVDLFMVQSPDPDTPLEEVAAALQSAVTSGRAHYVGVCHFSAWQVAYLAGLMRGGVSLSAAQAEYSLVRRSPERELMAATQNLGIGFLGCAALGRGVLTGKYRHTIPADSRAASTHLAAYVEPYLKERFTGVIEAVTTAAQGLDVDPMVVAVAWALANPAVASSIVGPRTAAQLRPLLASDLQLPPQIYVALREASA